MIKTEGDIISLFEEDVGYKMLYQGCNCFSLFGGGLAGQIATKYADFTQQAEQGCVEVYPPYALIGTELCYKVSKTGYICNLFTQYYPGPYFNEVPFNNSLQQSLNRIVYEKLYNYDFTMYFPYIGSGIGLGPRNLKEHNRMLEERLITFEDKLQRLNPKIKIVLVKYKTK